MAQRQTTSNSAEALARRLGLRRSGNRYVGNCPACAYKNAFVICEGRDHPLVFCHACHEVDAVIAAIRARGLWIEKSGRTQTEPEFRRLGILARERWLKATAAADTLVETYLRSRGILLPPPQTLRFLPQELHAPSGRMFPVMLAAVTVWPERLPSAVHRTFLAHDGQSKAPVETSKMTLGPIRRGAVRLAAATEHLLVGEGIETCLAAMQASKRPAWAALSTGGLKVLELPSHVRMVTILADADPPGEQAAQAAATRWTREGRRVLIARPPEGKDFNDLLTESDPLAKERTT